MILLLYLAKWRLSRWVPSSAMSLLPEEGNSKSEGDLTQGSFSVAEMRATTWKELRTISRS